jgi:hypothetical protein
MHNNKFGFIEIADEVAAQIDGGFACPGMTAAIDRWQSSHPFATRNRQLPVTTSIASAPEISPLAGVSLFSPMMQLPANFSRATAMAVGDETVVSTSTLSGGANTSSSFSMS